MIKHARILGPGITSRVAVPASHTQVLDNDDEQYLYVRSRNYVTRGSPCVTYASLENADVAYLFIGPGIMSRAAVLPSSTQVL